MCLCTCAGFIDGREAYLTFVLCPPAKALESTAGQQLDSREVIECLRTFTGFQSMPQRILEEAVEDTPAQVMLEKEGVAAAAVQAGWALLDVIRSNAAAIVAVEGEAVGSLHDKFTQWSTNVKECGETWQAWKTAFTSEGILADDRPTTSTAGAQGMPVGP